MRKFLAKATVIGLTATLTLPLMEACVISLPFVDDIVLVGGDDSDDLEDELEDIFDELDD